MNTDRYNRQTLLKDFGDKAQKQLSSSTVAIVGIGALGSHHAETFTRMGVGKLILIDRDFVELSNLNRQVLFTEADADEQLPKAEAAKRHLKKLNSDPQFISHIEHLSPANIEKILEGADLILDGTDNFKTRYLLNDFSRKTGKPFIYAGVVGYEATCFPILPDGPCLRCLFRDSPDPSTEPACDTAGVWPPSVSLISALSCDLALRWIINEPPSDGWPLHTIDLASSSITRWDVFSYVSEDCPACNGNYEYLKSEETEPVHLCGTGIYQVLGGAAEIDFESVKKKLEHIADISANRFLLRFETEDGESISLFKDGRAIIRGVDSTGRAQAIYDRYIGS